MRNIIIYRHQQFLPSESFIYQQTKYLRYHQPIFVGRHQLGPLPNNTIQLKLLSETGKLNTWQQILFRHPTSLYHLLKPYQPTLLHAHFGVEGVYALPLANRLRVPLITTFHGFDVTSSNKKLLTAKKISLLNYLLFRKQLAHEGQLFICVSNYIRDCLLKLKFPEERIVTHYTGVDINLFKPKFSTQTYPIILTVARLVKNKGINYLLEAFAKLQNKYAGVNLVIIGDGPCRTHLERLASHLNITPHVNFLGVQSQAMVLYWLQQASIFCLPSLSEGLGMVLLEAAACGLPIVASQVGGVPEAIIGNTTGLLVKPSDPNALAERLGYLLDHSTLAQQMGNSGRKLMQEKFDLQQQTTKLEEIYRKLSC